jgi:DGQHR domain-containing protein
VTASQVIKRRALLVAQNRDHPLYLFALTGAELGLIADLSRVGRDDTGDLIGYQRPEVRAHVKEITQYLDSDSPVLPNAIILAISSSVKFKQIRGSKVGDGLTEAGTIEISVPRPGEARPAFIVDGQQRLLALQAAKNKLFPVPVAAFVADTVDEQRDQFVRVNSSRPLPPSLVTELLPKISTPISPRLSAKRLPSALVEQLNQDPTSPFFQLIKRPSGKHGVGDRQAVVTDTSLVEAIRESLASPSSCLYPFRNLTTGDTDTDGIWAVLLCYWTAVRETFPDAWGKPPTKSRLMHGAGIRAMGRLMDRVMVDIDARDEKGLSRARSSIEAIEPECRWTHGVWENLDNLAWNQVNNTPQHIQLLSNHLIRLFVHTKVQH